MGEVLVLAGENTEKYNHKCMVIRRMDLMTQYGKIFAFLLRPPTEEEISYSYEIPSLIINHHRFGVKYVPNPSCDMEKRIDIFCNRDSQSW